MAHGLSSGLLTTLGATRLSQSFQRFRRGYDALVLYIHIMAVIVSIYVLIHSLLPTYPGAVRLPYLDRSRIIVKVLSLQKIPDHTCHVPLHNVRTY